MISLIELTQKPHIGSDETLKGDTFGGLVVCACYTDQTEKFLEIGVKDSKLLTNKQIERIGKELLTRYSNKFFIVELMPKEYNDLLKTQNQTQLLNNLHKKVAKELQEQFGKIPHFVDEFPGCDVGDVSETKAESISLAVAAASIVARYKGLLQFEELSRRAGFKLPMGSTHVSKALSEIVSSDIVLGNFVKLHFKNVKHAVEKSQQGQKTFLDGF